jgi:hypothetical protein
MAQDLCNKHQRQKDLGNASVSWRHCSLVVKLKVVLDGLSQRTAKS